MVTTLAETNRMAIATKLANMKALQNLLISNEVELMGICSTDMEIKERLKWWVKTCKKRSRPSIKSTSRIGRIRNNSKASSKCWERGSPPDENPDNSIWGQADDAIAALKGIFGGLGD